MKQKNVQKMKGFLFQFPTLQATFNPSQPEHSFEGSRNMLKHLGFLSLNYKIILFQVLSENVDSWPKTERQKFGL